MDEKVDFGLSGVVRCTLSAEPLDMRCGMDGLLARVVALFGAAQPHTAYAFSNARATRIKVLVHDGQGLWLHTRRLHGGRFHWTAVHTGSVQLNAAQWAALTLGLRWQSVGRAIEHV